MNTFIEFHKEDTEAMFTLLFGLHAHTGFLYGGSKLEGERFSIAIHIEQGGEHTMAMLMASVPWVYEPVVNGETFAKYHHEIMLR